MFTYNLVSKASYIKRVSLLKEKIYAHIDAKKDYDQVDSPHNLQPPPPPPPHAVFLSPCLCLTTFCFLLLFVAPSFNE